MVDFQYISAGEALIRIVKVCGIEEVLKFLSENDGEWKSKIENWQKTLPQKEW